ncbi:MAG: hypothetical protein AB1817_17875, partial [Chloroflexota bacterium]
MTSNEGGKMSLFEPNELLKRFSKPIEIISWIMIAAGLVVTDLLPLEPGNRRAMYVVVFVAALYTG